MSIKVLPKDHSIICSLEITHKKENDFIMLVSEGELQTKLTFNPFSKELQFLEQNELSQKLLNNIYQLRKILHNKRKKTFFEGFKLKFVLKNNKRVIDFNNTDKLVLLDKTGKERKSSPIDYYPPDCPVFFTDGSSLPKLKRSAAAVILKKTNGLLSLYTVIHHGTKSSQTELLAAIKAASIGQKYQRYRIATDSRYVIKGLTEWIHNWKLNNWQTAQGTAVKNIEYWKMFDKLSENKIIEFRWIKGHSQQFENTLCDKYAKEAAEKPSTNSV